MIVDYLKSCSMYILAGLIVRALCSLIESDFLVSFLSNNLITLLIALLAINTTTGSVVMTKLREIMERHGADFSATLKELRASIVEQLVFIFLAIVFLVILGSKHILEMNLFVQPLLESGLIAVFIASLYNLYDTANSIFVILSWEGRQ
ncbi:hypothetical protein L9G16_09250 [Shewanella sp. A25]|nr:hypothetical protein [Shewanella shenzhenensis]